MNIPSDHVPDAPLSRREKLSELLTIVVATMRRVQDHTIDGASLRKITRLVDAQFKRIKRGRRRK